MPRADMYAVPGKDAGLRSRWKSECEINGEHWGDPVTVWNHPSGDALERWTCCEETTVLGEIFDCDTCLEPGIRDGAMPPGWVEDSNGFHCQDCQ